MRLASAGRLCLFGMLLTMGCGTKGTVRMMHDTQRSVKPEPVDRSAAQLSNYTAEHIAWAKAHRARLVSGAEPRTIENTLVPYNEMMMRLDAAKAECELFARVHPDAQVREVAEEGEQEVSRFLTDLRLDRGIFGAFESLDVSAADRATQYLVFKVLRDFRRGGVDRGDEVRARIAQLNDEIVKTGQEFARNIRDDVRHILLDSPAELAGLPQDWIDKHEPGADGKIKVTTRSPDYEPFIRYARSADARQALYMEFRNRGYPQNIEVLDRLLAKRFELSRLLGYPNWAAYITEDKMIGSAENARSFIERVADVAREPAQRDFAMLLERKRQDSPSATAVADWEKDYYEQQVKSERFALDPQSVRPYFNFPDVRNGLFKLTGTLFGVSYREVTGLELWHEDVTAWDIYEGDTPIGRFYLDLHPRDNKYGHAAQFDYRTGIAGVRLPQAALVCNFPDPDESRDGVALMEHEQVVTFFHEFGHLLHALFAGHRQWIGNSGISTEWDFVEAPSQILEEWCFDPDALRVFAKHYLTREPIPVELVQRLKKAEEFGKGLFAAHQMFYASVSLGYYDRDPAEVDTTDLMVAMQTKYSPFDYVEGTHFHCSFGHLDHYSASYYTYMWSLVIAKDMFSRFEEEGILNPDTSRRYRRTILDPGGSKPAAELVQDFLGRPYSFEAFEAWLHRS